MLDRKYIVDNAEQVKQNCQHRGVTADVDRLVDIEAQRRIKQNEAQELNTQANANNKLIKQAANDNERQLVIEAGRKLREQKDACLLFTSDAADALL